jgi:hypothetical protein
MEDGDDVETNILCRIGNCADDAGYAVTAKLLSDRADIGGACGFHRVQVGEITEKDKAGYEAGRKSLYGLKSLLHLSGADVTAVAETEDVARFVRAAGNHGTPPWLRRCLQKQDAFLEGGREFISGRTLIELRLLDNGVC